MAVNNCSVTLGDNWNSETKLGWNDSQKYYAIALDTDELKALSEGQLALQVFTANEDSDPTDLNGPADFNMPIPQQKEQDRRLTFQQQLCLHRQ